MTSTVASDSLVRPLDEESVYDARRSGVLSAEGESFTLIDLFAGAGGLTLGFTGEFGHTFRPSWANDWDAAAAATYSANFGPHCFEGDILSLLADPTIEIPEADTVRPERRPKSRALGEASRRWIARTAAAAALPSYRVAPVPSWSLLERRTVTRADPFAPKLHVGPSERGSFGAPKHGVPHDRYERGIHLTAEASRAGPLGSPARSRAPQMGSRTDRGQPLLREGGGLSRGCDPRTPSPSAGFACPASA